MVIEKLTEIVENSHYQDKTPLGQKVSNTATVPSKVDFIDSETENLSDDGNRIDAGGGSSGYSYYTVDDPQQVEPLIVSEDGTQRGPNEDDAVVVPISHEQEVIIETIAVESDTGSSRQVAGPVVLKLPSNFGQLNLSNTHMLLESLISLNHDQLYKGEPGGAHILKASNGDVLPPGVVIQTIGSFENGTLTQPLSGQGQLQVLTSGRSSANLPVHLTVATDNQLVTPGGAQGGKSSGSMSPGGATNETFSCDKCDYSSHNKHYLKQHIELVHRTDRPFKCPFCDYAGKRSHSLKEHLVVHSTNRPYECPICNATFRKKGHLTTHVKLHNTFKYFECNICQEKYNDRTQLYGHLREAHDPEQVYSCKVCDYATTIKSNIVMHMHTHGNPEVYRCNICSFAALHINILWQHMETHTGIDPNASYNIERRSIKPQPVILLKCSECGYTTDRKDALQKHMWQHLPEDAGQTVLKTGQKEGSERPNDVSSDKQTKENSVDKEESVLYRCSETDCTFSCEEAYVFITHMLSHKPRQKVAAQFQQKQQEQAGLSSQSPSASQGFTHDSAVGMYRCTICGYMCEHQRTIKAHIWKHSGHKDIDYPMFQNGPLSVYDDTPVGKAVLLTGGNQMRNPPIKVIPMPEETVSESGVSVSMEEGTEEALVAEGDLSLKGPLVESTEAAVKVMVSEASQKGPIVNEVSCMATPMPSAIVASHPTNYTDMTVVSPQVAVPVIRSVMACSTGIQPQKMLPATPKGVMLMPPGIVRLQCLQPSTGANPQLLRKLAPGSLIRPVSLGARMNSPAASSPEIVQLILGQTQGVPKGAESLGVDGSLKRKTATHVRIEEVEDGDPMLGVAKRFCSEGDVCISSSGNVVVQQMAQVYTTPKISMTSYHGTSPSLRGLESTNVVTCSELPHTSSDSEKLKFSRSAVSEAKVEEVEQIVKSENDEEVLVTMETVTEVEEVGEPVQITEVVVETGSAMEVSDLTKLHKDTVTLLSLLKKAPHCTAVSPIGGPLDRNEEGCSGGNSPDTEADPNDADGQGAHHTDDKPKKGICSSLLAVIEQLRERSKSESEGDDGTDSNKSVPRPGGKRKNRRNSVEEDMPIEQFLNVEKLSGECMQYRCKLCHYTSSSTALIRTHMRLHKTKRPFECSLCDHQAEASESLQEHMLQHCKVRTYHCKVCTAVFNYKSQLRAHMRAHNEKDPFLCDLCDYETANPIAFRNHSRVHAEKSKVAMTPSCSAGVEILDETHPSESEFPREVMSTEESNTQCDECGFRGNSHEELCSHIQSHHSKSYKCEHCDFVSPIFSALRNHWRVHVEEQPLKCELCDFKATSSRSVKSHMKRHVNDQRFVQQPLEQYKCNMCGYVCHHLPSLKSHMWRHASDENYSYQQTNDVINAAIDFDTKPATTEVAGTSGKGDSTPLNESSTQPETGISTAVLSSKADMTTESKSNTRHTATTGSGSNTQYKTTTSKPAHSADNATGGIGENSVASTAETSVIARARDAKQPRTCLVAFRCCQCGFESVNKAVLNSHMKTHMDIIRKTLEVNRSRMVTRVPRTLDIDDKDEANEDKGIERQGRAITEDLGPKVTTRHLNLKERINYQSLAS